MDEKFFASGVGTPPIPPIEKTLLPSSPLPPRARWKFKLPQGLIKLSPHPSSSWGAGGGFHVIDTMPQLWKNNNKQTSIALNLFILTDFHIVCHSKFSLERFSGNIPVHGIPASQSYKFTLMNYYLVQL